MQGLCFFYLSIIDVPIGLNFLMSMMHKLTLAFYLIFSLRFNWPKFIPLHVRERVLAGLQSRVRKHKQRILQTRKRLDQQRQSSHRVPNRDSDGEFDYSCNAKSEYSINSDVY